MRKAYLALKQALLGRVSTKYIGHGSRIRIDLSTGGFVEVWQSLDRDANSGYIRIHLGKPKRVHDLDETYKYVHYGSNRDNLSVLNELHFALINLEDKQMEFIEDQWCR